MTTDQSSEQSACPHIDHGDFTLCETERQRRADQSSEQRVEEALAFVEDPHHNFPPDTHARILAAAVRDLTAERDLYAQAAEQRDACIDALEVALFGDLQRRSRDDLEERADALTAERDRLREDVRQALHWIEDALDARGEAHDDDLLTNEPFTNDAVRLLSARDVLRAALNPIEHADG